MSIENSSQSTEQPYALTSDSTGPRLCTRCSYMIQSGDSEGVLFNHGEMDNLAPTTCPFCAIIEFDSSVWHRDYTMVTYKLRNLLDLKQCTFEFHTQDGYSHVTDIWQSNNHPRRWPEIQANTITKETIPFLKDRLRVCVETHKWCRPPRGPPPTRLLRLEPLQEGGEQICLEDTDREHTYQYITLSHCWGKALSFTLTKDTEAYLRAGIRSETLAKTFREAVFVCLNLGFQFIWIDCLCIFQDDLQDWATEAARMHSVYRNAILNIAATAAPDSTAGLSSERNPLAHKPFSLTIDPSRWFTPPDWSEAIITESPLNKRAWVFQERSLSLRVIHFTVAGVCWECVDGYATEANQDGTLFYYAESGGTDTTGQNLKKFISLPSDHSGGYKGATCNDVSRPDFADWLRGVSYYTECGITKDTDKLVAIKGIGQTLKEVIGVELVCGMWKSHLIAELLWEVSRVERASTTEIFLFSQRKDPPPLLDWRAPTWSWASRNYQITPTSYPAWHKYCTSWEEVARIVEASVDEHPTGQVLGACLRLEGNLVHAKIDMAVYHRPRDSLVTVSCGSDEIKVQDRCFIFDILPSFLYTDELTFFTLARCHCTKYPDTYSYPETKKPSMASLILRPDPNIHQTYSRVGVLRIASEEACDFFARNQCAEPEVIALV